MSRDMEKIRSGFKIENNIVKGAEVRHQIGYTSLGEFVLDKLEKSPDFVGEIDALTDEEYTYEKMRDRSVRCALWMRSQGLGQGDLVATCSHNQLDVAIPCFGALYLGAAFNSLDVEMNAKEMCRLMRITRPKLAFVNEESAPVVAEAAREARNDLKIIVFGRAAGFLEFESIIAEPEADQVKNFRCAAIGDPDQTAVVICSSGTTGLPKGVALGHRAILQRLNQSQNLRMAKHNCLLFSSLYWITGVIFMFYNLYLEITRIITPIFEERTACELVEKYQISWIFLSSSMMNRLLKSGELGRHDLSSVKRVCYGGAPLALASRNAFAELLPNALITAAYGLTEFCGLLSIQSKESKPGSNGQIVNNAQVKVVDPTTGRILGANERGELFLKSTAMMSFYFGDPQATAAILDDDGWLHSGDLGYFDEDGEIFVVDRLKEMIKYRGYQVSPVEIESLMLSHPGVKEVAVVGLPHPLDDEHPIAFVVKNGDSTVTEKELIDLVAAEFSDSKQLRGGVKFLDSLPKSPSDKVRRKQLRDLAEKLSVGSTSD